MSPSAVSPAASVFGAASTTVIGVPATVVWVSPTSPRQIDAAALTDSPSLDAWATTLTDDDRRGLIGRVETHALLGEPVDVVEHAGEWTKIRLLAQPSSKDPVGYPGWVRTAHLAARVQPPRDASLVVIRGARTVQAEATDGSPLALSIGTILPMLGTTTTGETSTAPTLILPDGRTVRVPTSAVAPIETKATPEDALAVATLFAASPYLWAGTSSAGVDCSGLVHISYRCLGLVVPRDADDQAVAARGCALTDVRPGDPVFFANERGVHHVALALGDGTKTFHAPQTGRAVGPGDWTSPAYNGETVTAVRFL